MAKLIDGTSLFTTMNSGLTNTHSILSNQFKDGISLENLASTDANNVLTSNSMGLNFKSYLQNNFNTIDTDSDGVISSNEIQSLTNSLTGEGMTLEQLYQLGSSSGVSTSLLETVISHFNEIDSNKDGKVTNSEIQAYGVSSSVENQKKNDMDKMIASMSTYYETEASNDTSSLLDYKYLTEDDEV